ncbi:ABC transporter permease [Pelomonas sp. V22]|uniref:ABC transporter permease n=1 Tax=Pelomonas sp. V22 TaxID=2822139 RepID=UPI0024A93FA7|nr:FtsX-like permease family protein [Pelomonas sp. V22]MDI4634283.1 ABC transporter permease [Pelomonas sp. V22]
MDLMPILATLKRHKTAAGLIVLQVALTCAIVCNALFLIFQRIERMEAPSGIVENELLTLSVSSLTRTQDPDAITRMDLQALRALPGVKSVSLVNQIPYKDNFWATGIRLKPDSQEEGLGVANYMVAEGWLQTLGLKLVAGRDFAGEEYRNQSEMENDAKAGVSAVLINQALADKLFPGKSAVGESLYGGGGDQPSRIVGVVERLVSPQPGGTDSAQLYTLIQPIRQTFRGGVFLMRVEPGQRQAILNRAASELEKMQTRRVVREKNLFTDLREKYYRQDMNMAWLMGAVCIALLLVTAFGIVGLASFWVQQRTRMIGTRRALGATRGQILRYFQAENFLLTSLGLVLGMAAAYGISVLLMKNYELPRLPLFYLPVGAVTLFLLGQLAVLSPARRAAALPPVAALRS